MKSLRDPIEVVIVYIQEVESKELPYILSPDSNFSVHE